MQSKLIKAFFRGTLSDEIIRSPRSDEYKDIDRRETALYDKLRPQLTGDQLKLFDESTAFQSPLSKIWLVSFAD